MSPTLTMVGNIPKYSAYNLSDKVLERGACMVTVWMPPSGLITPHKAGVGVGSPAFLCIGCECWLPQGQRTEFIKSVGLKC